MPKRLILPLVLGVVSIGTPCVAEDVMLDGKPCNTLCQSWMGYKPPNPPTASTVAPAPRREEPQSIAATRPPAPSPQKSVTRPPASPAIEPPAPSPSLATVLPSSAAAPAAEAHAPLPSAEEGADIPPLDTLVAVRGAIIVESASDQALQRSRMAALLKETTRPGAVGDERRGRQAEFKR